MKNGPTHGVSKSPAEISSGWNHRALIFAVVAVLIATLFPFQFLPQETAYRRTHFFLLWLTTQPSDLPSFLENILFFVPFGFGLACWPVRKGWQRFWGLLAALAAGAAFSFFVEFLQVFLPTRTASWCDVIANAVGSGVGFLIFEGWGGWILHFASALETKVEQFLTTRRIVALFVAYSGLTLFCSAELQRSSNLTSWASGDTLFVGNDATERHPWRGRILRVEIANEVLLLGSRRGAGNTPKRDNNRQPSLAQHVFLNVSAGKRWTSGDNSVVEEPTAASKERGRDHPGMDSIRGTVPAAALINELRKTNRFTLRVLCVPSEAAENSVGTIVSLSRDPRHVDFYLSENKQRWVVGIRSAVAGESLYWDSEFSNIPMTGKQRDITVTYDGSGLVASVNGKPAARPLRLSPGASLIHLFKGVGTYNIYGYGLVYDGLVFGPLGFLLALAARKPVHRGRRRQMLLAIGCLLPPLLLEMVLSVVSSRPFRIENVILGGCLVLGSFLLLNADFGNPARCLQAQTLLGPGSLQG